MTPREGVGFSHPLIFRPPLDYPFDILVKARGSTPDRKTRGFLFVRKAGFFNT